MLFAGLEISLKFCLSSGTCVVDKFLRDEIHVLHLRSL